ncbi:MAG: 5'/3'-nucleotidase SurE [Anaerolineae bacterium]
MERPLILLTNDDGLRSPGLRAAAEAVLDLGDVLVVAPRDQQTGTGKAISGERGQVPVRESLWVAGREVPAYAILGTPAMAVLYGVLALVPRRPALLISGINYGTNLGTDVLASGTLGAALQAAEMGVPALAVSLETEKALHYDNSTELDFRAAQHFLRFFAQRMLAMDLPHDVDVLKVDIPREATPQTPWRVTRQSRQAYHVAFVRAFASPGGAPILDYDAIQTFEGVEPDSDIWATGMERVVSVTPLSLDLTSRVDLAELEGLLRSRR